MKKFFALILACIMMSSLAVIGADAAIIFQDNFTTMNENAWNYHKAAFYTTGGRLEGGAEAVVLESYYDDPEDPLLIQGWTVFTAQVEIYPLDIDRDGAHAAGLWCGDYGVLVDGADTRDMYFFLCDMDTGMFSLTYNSEDINSEDPTVMLAQWQGPAIEYGKSVIKMGIRVEPGKISGYVDGVEVVSYSKATIGTQNTPVLLWNRNNYIQFDNFILGDLEELKPVSEQTPTDTTAPNGGENTTTTTAPVTSVQTSVNVVGTDADGKEVTEIVSQIVTVAPADTNTNGSAGGLGANTGDMAVIIAAVMVVALGSAIIVKKVNVK